jgi:hypothetical protein
MQTAEAGNARVLMTRWRPDITQAEKDAIQAQNRDLTQPFNRSGFEYLAERGTPPNVAIAWEPAWAPGSGGQA